MNICITGALGHIGSQLLKSIKIDDGSVLHLVDNMANQRYCSLFDLPENNTIFHQIDIRSKEMDPIVKDSDIVIHLAAISDAESSVNNPELVQQINIDGLQNIIDLCAMHNTKLFFPSTTSVYGGVDETLNEDCPESSYQPQSPYAISKLKGEKLIQKAGNGHGLQFTIFRLGTIFGFSTGMRFNTAVNKFVFQAVSGQGISVWKTAQYQRRPYCDLIDAISAIKFIISNDLFDREIYNIVTVNLTVNDILTSIKNIIPDLQISYTESKIMNSLSYDVDNLKSNKKGFRYIGNLDASVKELIEKFRHINKNVTYFL